MRFIRKTYLVTLSALAFLLVSLLKIIPKHGMALTVFADWMLREKTEVQTDSGLYIFHTPNWLTKYRAKTLFSKEPETIAWINSFAPNCVFYDIGANVGIYSIYAASKRECTVVAFEPSAPNQDLLVRNIISNKLSNLITVCPIGLSNSDSILNMYMNLSGYSWGGAHNSLGVNSDQRGRPIAEAAQIKLPATKLDSIVKFLELPPPNHIKVDVDGLELLVLSGAKKTLETVESLMVEIDPLNADSSSAIPKLLNSVGLTLKNSFGENNLYIRSF